MAHYANDPPEPTTAQPLPATPDPQTAPGEPALSVGAVAAAIGAILAVVAAFGVNLTEAQTQAILGLVLTVGPLLLAWIIRGKVWSPKSVGEKVAAVRAEVDL